MAGSSTTFTETTLGSVKKIKCAWVSDSVSGAVSGTTTEAYSGRFIGLITDPGATAPTADYDISITDADSVDLLLGAGIDRHTSTTEFVAEASMAGVAMSQLTFNITAAGANKIGDIYLLIR
jgi:hypothetical protein